MKTDEAKVRLSKLLKQEFGKPITIHKYNAVRKTHHWLPSYKHIIKIYGKWSQAMIEIFGEEMPVYRFEWDEASIIQAVRKVINEYGNYPAVSQYRKWREQNPNIPSVQVITRKFGSYGALMTQLGQTNYKSNQMLTKEEVDSRLKVYFEDSSNSRKYRDYVEYRKQCPEMPSPAMINRYYGSWSDMMKAFGERLTGCIRGPKRKALTEEEKFAFKSLLEQSPRAISSQSYKDKRKNQPNQKDYPSYARILNEFGSWNEALNAIGMGDEVTMKTPKRLDLFSKEETSQQLRTYFETAEQPNIVNFKKYIKRHNQTERKFATMSEIRQYYGGWTNMLNELGLTVERRVRSRYSEEECQKLLKKAYLLLGTPLTVKRYEEGKKELEEMRDFPYYECLMRNHETWKEALEAAGIYSDNRPNLLTREFKQDHRSLHDFLDWCLNEK